MNFDTTGEAKISPIRASLYVPYPGTRIWLKLNRKLLPGSNVALIVAFFQFMTSLLEAQFAGQLKAASRPETGRNAA